MRRTALFLFIICVLASGLALRSSAPAQAADDCGGVLPYAGILSAGTYNLSSDCLISDTLLVSGAVTINGNGHTIDGDDKLVFSVDGGSLTTINVTITSKTTSSHGAGISSEHANLTVNNTTFREASGGWFGGGIYAFDSTITITGSNFTDNQAPEGGGIYADESDLAITSTTFSQNDSIWGAAIRLEDSTATITGSIFTENTAVSLGGNGGAIASKGGTTIIQHSTFSANIAGSYGGAVMSHNTNSTLIIDSTINDNTVNVAGGGLYAEGTASITLSGTSIAGNSSPTCYSRYGGEILDAGGNQEDDGTCLVNTIDNSDLPGQASSPPMCNVVGEDISAPGLPDGVYCRVLMRDGTWLTHAGTVPGNLAVAEPLIAVDAFRITGQAVTRDDFGGYTRVCLPGEGRLVFVDAAGSPRPQVEIAPVTFEGGATCGWIPNAGTLVLLPSGE